METKRTANHGLELLGLMMVGEGVVGLLYRRRYSLFWRVGPEWMRAGAEWFAEHPYRTRLFCVGEIAAGLWLSTDELDEV